MEDVKSFWSESGYLVKEGFLSPHAVEKLNQLQDEAWERAATDTWVYDLTLGMRKLMRDVSLQDRQTHRFKLNDLYLDHEILRSVALEERLTSVLEELTGSPAVLAGSMQMLHGCAQPLHIDSNYIATPTRDHLITVWLALEDVQMDAGPVVYYPGSHNIPLYGFSNGTHRTVKEEMPAWTAYMEEQLCLRGIQGQRFVARTGDILIWHADLYHGGTQIVDHRMTRRSCVFHYFSEHDCKLQDLSVAPHGNRGWLDLRAQIAKH